MPALPPPVTELSVRAAEVSGPVGAGLDGLVVVLGPDSFDRRKGVPLAWRATACERANLRRTYAVVRDVKKNPWVKPSFGC